MTTEDTMSDNLTPTPYAAGYTHGRMDAAHDDQDNYNPPMSAHAEYDKGYQKALNDWDLEHGADPAEDDDGR
jgi:hypothetical protein